MHETKKADQRRQQRWPLIYYLRVFDQATDQMMGHIADISAEGMMLVHEQPIETNKEFSIWMEIPREEGRRSRVSLNAMSLWTKVDVNPDFFRTGFRLLSPSESVIRGIEDMVQALGFSR